jgi:hypothetical protein
VATVRRKQVAAAPSAVVAPTSADACALVQAAAAVVVVAVVVVVGGGGDGDGRRACRRDIEDVRNGVQLERHGLPICAARPCLHTTWPPRPAITPPSSRKQRQLVVYGARLVVLGRHYAGYEVVQPDRQLQQAVAFGVVSR